MTTINKSELFSLANKLRRANNLSQKEAFAAAKAQLSSISADSIIDAMKQGNVKFSFINNHGKTITTTGTLKMDRVPTQRKVEGSKIAKHSNMCVFYDVRHGVWRQFDITKVTAFHAAHPKK